MRVLLYGLSAVSGGAVSYLRNISCPLNRFFEDSPEGHELVFLAHESQKLLLPTIPPAQCVWVKGERPAGYRRVLWEYRHVAAIAQEHDIDVVFTPYQIGPRVKGLKQVLMLRNMEPFQFRRYHYSPKSRLRNQLLLRHTSRALRNADRCIAVSGHAQSCLEKDLDVPPKRIRRIYHGRDTAFSPGDTARESRSLLESLGVRGDFLLTCGSLLPYRRCEDVISAFNQCADALGTEATLVIAGSGTDARYASTIQRAISASPYRHRILCVGHVEKQTMISLYRECMACIVATEIEACPNIAIEAMCSGCLIISSDCPPLPEMFESAAHVFIARDIQGMANSIIHSVKDDPTREALRQRALKRAQDFSWATCAEQTYAALTEWSY